MDPTKRVYPCPGWRGGKDNKIKITEILKKEKNNNNKNENLTQTVCNECDVVFPSWKQQKNKKFN